MDDESGDVDVVGGHTIFFEPYLEAEVAVGGIEVVVGSAGKDDVAVSVQDKLLGDSVGM